MARDTLTGGRIRERRLIAGMRQAELAREAGISASYLNLIEHNRRRIGGKLLVNIAHVLGVEPSMLSEGAEAALISTLREAAADADKVQAETERVDEFAGRFPGWAQVLAQSHRRIASLERTVDILSDRLSHDPDLAASLHEVLSTAASIRSTASILAETGDLEPKWRDRFHRNLNEDSLRLAESSKTLVSYLDESDRSENPGSIPREEAEAFCAAQGYHFPELEEGLKTPEELVEGRSELASRASRRIAVDFLRQYRSDALALPLEPFSEACAKFGPDPAQLAGEFGAGIPEVLRRIAAMPETVVPQGAGLVICDSSGGMLLRKNVEGFAMPRFGVPCPLWPLFLALNRPLVALRRDVVQAGRGGAGFTCYAQSWPVNTPDLTENPLYHSVMLILPKPGDEEPASGTVRLGSTCRVCPRQRCIARREPSVLREDF